MDLMQLAWTGLAVFGALGLVAGVALALAAVRCKVEVDPRIAEVKEALMGANCGGCSYPGCEAYAEAVVKDPDVPPDLCRPGGPSVAAAVARLTGKAMGGAEPVAAFRRCVKDEGKVARRLLYSGVSTCQAASLALGGPDACRFACIGLGDCVAACPFGAMRLENGLVRVDAELCTGCGNCVRVCPKSILELTPRNARVQVFCSSRDKGREVKDVCEAGCISCGMCVKKCPAQAVSLDRGRISVDHKACVAYGPSCGLACAGFCPRGILRPLGDETPTARPEPEARQRAAGTASGEQA
ncbi:Fe-S cluster domain-containing protein [Desulfovibrio aminophilus]|nr:Fe-S cluster domain-containing protein [Desulfovibrio aminophilus]MCM0756704.1 Fe-S cluster domain-containing protein [Desulfovibrio aminophilus]